MELENRSRHVREVVDRIIETRQTPMYFKSKLLKRTDVSFDYFLNNIATWKWFNQDNFSVLSFISSTNNRLAKHTQE